LLTGVSGNSAGAPRHHFLLNDLDWRLVITATFVTFRRSVRVVANAPA
jgi:hypothetical protein